MNKFALGLMVLTLTASCSYTSKFYDDVVGKEPYQPVPSNKRTPLLNNAQQGAGLPERTPITPMAFNNVPQAPEPWGAPSPMGVYPQPQPMGQPRDVMRTPVGQLPELSSLPAERRAPVYNSQSVPGGVPPMRAQARPVMPVQPIQPQLPQFTEPTPVAIAPEVVMPAPVAAAPRAVPLPIEPMEYPRLAQIPPASKPPIPLDQDPRVQELKRMNPNLAMPMPPQPPELWEDDNVIPVPPKPVVRAPIPEFTEIPAPAPRVVLPVRPAGPSTDFSQLKPIEPRFAAPITPEPIRPEVNRPARTNYNELQPIATPTHGGNVDLLPPSRYANRAKIYRRTGSAWN